MTKTIMLGRRWHIELGLLRSFGFGLAVDWDKRYHDLYVWLQLGPLDVTARRG